MSKLSFTGICILRGHCYITILTLVVLVEVYTHKLLSISCDSQIICLFERLVNCEALLWCEEIAVENACGWLKYAWSGSHVCDHKTSIKYAILIALIGIRVSSEGRKKKMKQEVKMFKNQNLLRLHAFFFFLCIYLCFVYFTLWYSLVRALYKWRIISTADEKKEHDEKTTTRSIRCVLDK